MSRQVSSVVHGWPFRDKFHRKINGLASQVKANGRPRCIVFPL